MRTAYAEHVKIQEETVKLTACAIRVAFMDEKKFREYIG